MSAEPVGIRWADRHGVVHCGLRGFGIEWFGDQAHEPVMESRVRYRGCRRHLAEEPEWSWQLKALAGYLAATSIVLFGASMLGLWLAGGGDYVTTEFSGRSKSPSSASWLLAAAVPPRG